MKQLDKLRMKWKGLSDTILRFPLTIILFAAVAVSNAIAIYTDEDEIYIKLMVMFFMGACIFIVLQLLYERFFTKNATRIIFMGISLALALIYGILIWNTNWEEDVAIRTIVVFFILLVAFLIVPVIKSRNNFNESFMSAFKGFFVTLLFYGVLFLGVALIFLATDMLITNVDEDAYLHAANIIFVFLAPVYFLSLVPYYPGKKELESLLLDVRTDSAEQQAKETEFQEKMVQEEESVRRREALAKQTSPTRFLETLISYVIIPITAVFTIILLLYIIMNITGDFWTDNLMEPLLVAYSITVIIVYLLASTLNNVFATYFRRIFPKVLLPVVLFQTISSILRIGELGVTHGRYYVIMFGVFATVAGILFCIIPVHKNGIIAPILIGLSIISIVPPVDAFTTSKINQTTRLEKTLNRNSMLSGDTITSNANISEEDKQIIVSALNYLNRMEYKEDVTWLSSYNKTLDFEKTFGFTEYGQPDTNYESYYLARDMKELISISGYDYMVRINIYKKVGDIVIDHFEKDGRSYILRLDSSVEDNQAIILEETDGQELIHFEYNNIFTQFTGTNSGKEALSTQELTFTQENDLAVITIVAESISVSEWTEGRDQTVDGYILIKIK